MPTLQEILDGTGYTDTLEFADSGTGTKFTLGDLRKFRTGSLDLERLAGQKKVEAERLAGEAAALLQKLTEDSQTAEKAKAAAAAAAARGEEGWRKDPFYLPVVGELEKTAALIQKLVETVEANKRAQDQGMAIMSLYKLRMEYDAKRELFGDRKFEDVAREVVQSKMVDQYGVATLSPMIDRLGEPSRMKKAADDAVAEARKKWEQETAMASSTKPGAGARFRNVKPADRPIAKIEDLTSDLVANDPDVRAAMEGTVQ